MFSRHPGIFDIKNAKNKARWAERYYGGVHCADLRNQEQYRQGEWIALRISWLRRGYRMIDRVQPIPEQLPWILTKQAS